MSAEPLTIDALIPPGPPLARGGVMEARLEGLAPAQTYAPTTAMACTRAMTDVLDAPGGRRVDQLLMGEAYDVLACEGGFALGRNRRGGTIGWVDAADLGEPKAPTHWVRAVSADGLPQNALVTADAADPGALLPIGVFAADPLEAAMQWLGVAYAPGGRTFAGTDCSGLVQQALHACGLPAPRYGREQAMLGRAAAIDDVRRGDLIVWPIADDAVWTGHSALAAGNGQVLHAVGDIGRVVLEPLDQALARGRANGFGEPVARRLGF